MLSKWSLLSGATLIVAAACLTSLAPKGVNAADAILHTDLADPAAPAPPVPEPAEYRMDDFRKPVPATLKGAKVLSNDQALALWNAKSAVFIDVYPHPPKPANLPKGTLWRDPTHQTIENGVWLANTGFGALSAASDQYFRTHLEQLSGRNLAKPLVFYCLRNCWMSWNAAKRALEYGYTNVNWYRDGTDGWQEIGGLMVEVKPMP